LRLHRTAEWPLSRLRRGNRARRRANRLLRLHLAYRGLLNFFNSLRRRGFARGFGRWYRFRLCRRRSVRRRGLSSASAGRG
jgi:hypothetical protein